MVVNETESLGQDEEVGNTNSTKDISVSAGEMVADTKLHSTFTDANSENVIDASSTVKYLEDKVESFLRSKNIDFTDPDVVELLNHFKGW